MKDIYKEVSAMSDVVEAMQQGFQDIAFVGDGQKSSVTGTTFTPDLTSYIWALVNAPSNTTLANNSCGIPHSWTQIVPLANACNGSTNTALSGTANSNAAYDPNGNFLATATVTKLYPGASVYNTTSNTFQTEWWFETSGGGKHCNVKTTGVVHGGTTYYPAKFRSFSADAWGNETGATYDAFLVQAIAKNLTTSGSAVYTGLPKGSSITLTVGGNDYTLPIYGTTEMPTCGVDGMVQN